MKCGSLMGLDAWCAGAALGEIIRRADDKFIIAIKEFALGYGRGCAELAIGDNNLSCLRFAATRSQAAAEQCQTEEEL